MGKVDRGFIDRDPIMDMRGKGAHGHVAETAEPLYGMFVLPAPDAAEPDGIGKMMQGHDRLDPAAP